MPRQWPSAGHHAKGPLGSGHSAARVHEGAALDALDEGAAVERREGEADAVLGEAEHGHHRRAAETGGGKALAEALHGVGADRLGTVAGHAPRTEVEVFDFAVFHAPQAQLVSEVGAGGQGAPVAVDGLQPALWPGQEGQGRHQDQGHGVVQAAQPGADQSHVVIQRQPTDEDIGGSHFEGRAHGPNVGQQVGMAQHHTLGIAGAARGVLQERGVARPRCCRRKRGHRRRHRVDGEHVAQAGHLQLEEAGGAFGLGLGDQNRGQAVVEDAHVAAQVFLDLAHACRWIHRNRNAAGEEGAEKRKEIIGAGGQHDGHGLARPELVPPERSSHPLRPLAQVAISDDPAFVVVAVEPDVGTLGMGPDVPVEHLDEGRCAVGCGLDRLEDDAVDHGLRRGRRRGAGAEHRAQQVARRFRLEEDAFGQGDAEGLLETLEQLDPPEAVKRQIPLQRAVEGRLRPRRRAGMQLGGGCCDDLEHPGRGFAVCRRLGHCLGSRFG